MNESLVKYLAGLLDADGSLSFSFKRDTNRPDRWFVGLSMNLTASDAIDRNGFVESLPEIAGMGTVSRYGDSKQFAVWHVGRRADLEKFVPRVTKHMAIKARHWQWLLEEWRVLRAKAKTVSIDEMLALKADSKASRQERVGPLKPKNHPSWAWAAGYLDGDGYYSYRQHFNRQRNHRQWIMKFGAVSHVNDASVLSFLQKTFGGIIEQRRPLVCHWNRALGYHNRSFALKVLPKLAKHSRLKKQKILAILHHHQQRLSVPGTPRRYCEVDGCERRRAGNGLCSMHYQRKRKEMRATV